MTPVSATIEQKFQRACALIQMLLNLGAEEWVELESEARAQLKAWGFKVPEPREEAE